VSPGGNPAADGTKPVVGTGAGTGSVYESKRVILIKICVAVPEELLDTLQLASNL
jgi:hypothetical protein